MIELVKVSKNYGQLRIFNEFSYVFKTGSKTAVTGPSGIGKTTLLSMIAGLVAIDEGSIMIEGVMTDTSLKSVHPAKRNLGFAFQFPALWPHMTVRGNIQYGLNGLDAKEKSYRFEKIIHDFELSDIIKKYPNEISGGQAKRVSLARTLVVKPKYLLLDEPLNNLDKELKYKVLNIIKEFVVKDKVTLIYVTHDLNEADSICDQVCNYDRFC